MEEALKTIVGYIAVAVPITVALGNVARVAMEWLNQRHKIKSTIVEQTHKITTHYLDRALDPTVPLAMRHQLFRFLATPNHDGSRLESWAKAELARVEPIVEQTNRAVEEAEKERLEAKTEGELAAAEEKLKDAIRHQHKLMEPPVTPPVTAASFRAGLLSGYQEGIELKNDDLTGGIISCVKFRKGNFSGSDFSNTYLTQCDLRETNLSKTILFKTDIIDSDLRGADLRSAKIAQASFRRSRLEGADFRDATFQEVDLRATYDDSTQWPENFDPLKFGGVKVNDNVEPSKEGSGKEDG
jgi:hypothetical protein